jgi:hypothetical protein
LTDEAVLVTDCQGADLGAAGSDVVGQPGEGRLELFRLDGHGLTIIGDGMKRSQLIEQTRRLIAEGERLELAPSLNGLRVWLQRSDDLLSTAWGTMDRYHLAWLMVGRPDTVPRGRQLTPGEEADYVREVARQKTAALRMSLRAADEQHMPFVGETPED